LKYLFSIHPFFWLRLKHALKNFFLFQFTKIVIGKISKIMLLLSWNKVELARESRIK
jgi:hypothetical protein